MTAQLLSTELLSYADLLWNYHCLQQSLQPAECMIVLGNDDLRTAKYAADLFNRGMAKYVVITGQASRHSSHFLPFSEAEKFAQVMETNGVSRAVLLLEHRATNTGENITFTHQLLAEKSLQPHSFLVVTKPYMERRALATFQKIWPNQQVVITSLPSIFTSFLDERHSAKRVINAMIGYVYRMRDYAQQGFQVEQEIPMSIWNAVHQLEARGFQRT